MTQFRVMNKAICLFLYFFLFFSSLCSSVQDSEVK